MRKNIIFIAILLIALSLAGCASKMTEDEYQALELEVHSMIKDVISYTETNLKVSDSDASRKVIVEHVEAVENNLGELVKQSIKSIPKDKKKEFETLSNSAEGGMLLVSSYLNHDYNAGSIEKIDEALTILKDRVNYDGKTDNVWLNKPDVKGTLEDSIRKYVEEFNVDLSWKDIQYDMSNNLDKEFLVAGTAELSDYYNYGFRNKEDSHFCVEITPYDGKYTNRWHLYLHRDSFKDLFNSLKDGSRNIVATCEIPDHVYKIGQGNMAFVNRARW